MIAPERVLQSVGRRIYQTQKLRLASASCVALLASYPKSGRTWVRFILANYFEKAVARPATDVETLFTYIPNYDLDPIRGLPSFLDREDRSRVPLILATHRSYRRLTFRRAPVIFIVRDPRDILVSAYFHATRHKGTFKGDMSAFLADRRLGLPPYIQYMNRWAKGLKRHSSLVIAYEELAADTASVMERVLRFVQVEPDQSVLQQAVDRSSIDALRRLEQRKTFPGHSYDPADPEALRMRRGKVGGYTDYLDRGMIEQIETSCRTQLNKEARSMLSRYQIAGILPAFDPPDPAPIANPTIVRGDSNELTRVAKGSLANQIFAQALMVIGIAAAVIAPMILAIEVGEWFLGKEWDGHQLKDGLALFGVDRSGTRETPWNQLADMLLALPLSFCLFMVGVLTLLCGVHLGNWGVSRVALRKRLGNPTRTRPTSRLHPSRRCR